MTVRLSKPFRPEIQPEVIEILEDFCSSHHDANATVIVNKAIKDFIPRDLSRNRGAKNTFDALQMARRAAKPDRADPNG